MANESHKSTSWNGTAEKTRLNDVLYYSYFAVYIFGILGNTLVIISILRQRCLLKNNYYFLVLQLATCDLAWLLMNSLDNSNVFGDSLQLCLIGEIVLFFQVGGIGMMLVISVLRYRAAVHPLQPAISRRKLTIICGLVYITGLIGGWAIPMLLCLMRQNATETYINLLLGYVVLCFYYFPTVFMIVVYYKILRALIKQNKLLKRVCSNLATRNTSSSFKILRHIRNRRTFIICLSTVLCYAVGNFPLSLLFIASLAGLTLNNLSFLIYKVSIILRIAGTCAVNPLIYGIFDKKLLTFWKLCQRKKREAR